MHRALLLLPVVLLLASCGNGGEEQDRPVVVSTWPANGENRDGMVRQIRVTYDDPITVLNQNSVVLSTGGVQIPLWFGTDPDDPHSLLFEAIPGFSFVPGDASMWVGAGLEQNQHEHYRLEDFNLFFRQGLQFSLFFAVPSPAAVHEVDADEFALTTVTPTPGGRQPIAMAGSAIGDQERMWVQLESGGGTGRSVALFDVGQTAMTEVALTVGAGGDLVAEAPTIRLGGDGRTVYAAFRDTAEQRVRLAAIDVVTGIEVDSLLLSPPATASTRPLGLVPNFQTGAVDLTVATGAGDFLVRVQTDPLEEVDLDPDGPALGLALPDGAGPISGYSNLRVVSPLGATTADLTIADPGAGVESLNESEIPGRPNVLFVTLDGIWIFQGLTDYVGDEALAIRWDGDITSANPRAVTADAGPGTPAATAVVSITNYPGRPRILVLFDNEVASVVDLVDGFWLQADLDDALDGEQGADVSTVAPGATFVTFLPPALPPDR